MVTEQKTDGEKTEDERYYVPCPKRKDEGKIAVTVCIKKCTYGRKDIQFSPADPMATCTWSKYQGAKNGSK